MEISNRQKIAITALVAGKTRAEAAEIAEVVESTLYGWLNNESFRQLLKDTQARVFDDAANELKAASLIAVRTLVEVAQDKEATASARVAASTAILGNCFKAVEQSEFRERLERLEQLLTEKNYEFQTIA